VTPTADSPDGWSPGSRLLDDYDVERDLGAGGFGHVVLVRNRRSGQPYALKRIRPRDHATQRRFRVEAQRWVELGGHPHVARCCFVKTVDDAPAIFSEYVEGGSLADWIADRRLYGGTGGAPLKRVLRIAVHAAWGLEAAHGRGLLHLDVKPSNVLLTPDGVAKLADFGLATTRASAMRELIVQESVLDMLTDFMPDQAQRDAMKSRIASALPGDEALEVTGGEGLSHGYSSPEQARGDRLTRATDIWSWAVTTLEMFAGARTWPSGPDAGIALDLLVADADAARALELPPEVAHLLRNCLRPDPSARPQSIGEVADRLAEVYRGACAEPLEDDRPSAASWMESVMESRPREAGGEMRWLNPRTWLTIACEAAGVDPEVTVRHWPGRTGTLHARLLEELDALIEARRIFEPVVGDEPALLVSLGHLTADIGRVRSFLRDRERAIQDLEAAGRVLAAAGEAGRVDRARVLTPLAGMLREVERVEDARAVATTAVELCRGMALADDGRATLAAALTAAAQLAADAGSAVDLYDEAIELFARVGDEVRRVDALMEKTVRLQAAGERERSARDWAQVDAAIEALLERGTADVLPVKAIGLLNRAVLATSDAERLPYAQAAVEVFTPLVTERRLFRHAGELGRGHFMSGQAQEHAGDVQAAIASYGRAREFLEQAVIQEGRPELAERLAEACDHESTLVRDHGDRRDAVALARRACEMWERLVAQEGIGRWGLHLAVARVKLASCLGDVDDPQAGLLEIDAVVRALEADPDTVSVPRARQELAAAHSQRGVLLRQMREFDAAVASYRDGLRVVKGEDRHVEARLLGNLGNALADAGAYTAALDASRQALAVWESLAAAEGADVPGGLRASLAEARHDLVKKLSLAGEYSQALEAADAAIPPYLELIAKGRRDLDAKLASLLGLRSMMLERMFDLHGAITALREACDRFAGMARADPQQHGEALRASSLRLDLLERLATVARKDVPGWVDGARHEMRHIRRTLGGESGPKPSILLFEDLVGHLVFILQREPDGGVLAACAEAAAGAGLLAAQAARRAAARRDFKIAMDCCRMLVEYPDHLTQLDHPLLVAAALTLAKGDDAAADALAAALDGRRQDPERLRRVPWTLVLSSDLTELRTARG